MLFSSSTINTVFFSSIPITSIFRPAAHQYSSHCPVAQLNSQRR